MFPGLDIYYTVSAQRFVRAGQGAGDLSVDDLSVDDLSVDHLSVRCVDIFPR